MSSPNENRFEEWIQQSLGKQGYQHLITHSNAFGSAYDKINCLLPEQFIVFIRATQEDNYQKLYTQFDEGTDAHLIKTFARTIKERGIVDTLRNGLETRGCSFSLLYFKPKSGLNSDHIALYQNNVFSAVRQLHYSSQNNNSIDIVLFANGIPVVTIEIKNQLTGQSLYNAKKQYKEDRDPKEPLLAFKRCLVHFAVDNDQVAMTTKLLGTKTKFFPYNKGIQNPAVANDYSSEYLWNEVLAPDSLLDIIENYAVIAQESSKEWNAKTKKVDIKKSESLYFPRYHQLDVIRKLQTAIKAEGTVKNYLIQHTTGAGKSMEIGWLAHSLTSLYQSTTNTQRMFDTVVVVTDRKVLDAQLQKTLQSLEQTSGVVNPVNLNSQQLKAFLEKGKDIIVTTVQKFGVIAEAITATKSKTFAVIIDEVHSSQSGETSKHLKKSLSAGIDSDHDQDDEYDLEDYIRNEIETRGKQPHISFFGFTGTPKNKTLELFGRKNSEGQFVPFHSYTMKQSIAEGYTLDVLANYTTFKRYFKVKEKLNEDIEVPSGEAKKVLMQFVDGHPEVIKNKVHVIVDHFIKNTAREINGTARAMVVVRSRLQCVLYQQEMKKQLREKQMPYTCLVAFSGSIKHQGEEHTEASLNRENGMEGSNIPDALKDPRFRILIVSSKYQTGFDEPMVHSMFVDKKLNGVQCVQTLSRLNRTKTHKANPVVIDFVNEVEDIQDSFQPYFTSTVLSEETDPDQLYSLVYEIEQFHLFTQYQVDEFAKQFYKPTSTDQSLQPLLNESINKYIELEEEVQNEFKSKIQSFVRLYAYIIQISGFVEVKWEKLFIFLKFLNKKLPRDPKEKKVYVEDVVELESLRIQFKGKHKITLEDEEGSVDPIGVAEGSPQDEDPLESLSEIINKINERHNTDFTLEDAVSMEQLQQRIMDNSEMTKVKNGNNTKDTVKEFYKKLLKDELVDYAADRMEFYKRMQKPETFMLAFEMMFDRYVNQKGV